jgi:hypothetical protein
MGSITPAEAQAYFERWELVKEIELAELRRTTMDTKLRQLSVLMASRSLFGVDPERENGTQLVRDRWARLWQASGGRSRPCHTAGRTRRLGEVAGRRRRSLSCCNKKRSRRFALSWGILHSFTSPVPRWERAHWALPHERHAGIRRLSMGRNSVGETRRLHEGTGIRERTGRHQTIFKVFSPDSRYRNSRRRMNI